MVKDLLSIEGLRVAVYPKQPRCRHERTSWILGGAWEWCYACGALRRLQLIPGTTNHLAPVTGWRKPVGLGQPNPSDIPLRRTLQKRQIPAASGRGRRSEGLR